MKVLIELIQVGAAILGLVVMAAVGWSLGGVVFAWASRLVEFMMP